MVSSRLMGSGFRSVQLLKLLKAELGIAAELCLLFLVFFLTEESSTVNMRGEEPLPEVYGRWLSLRPYPANSRVLRSSKLKP